MKKAASLLLGCLLTLGTGVAAAEKIRCVTLDFPPLEYVEGNGPPKGIAVDVVTKVFKAIGYEVEVELLPWARSLELTKLGERDCIFTAYKTPEREEFLDFSNQVLVPQAVYLYAKKGKNVKFDGDLAVLKSLRVGVQNKISYGPKFDNYKQNLNLDTVQSLDQNFRKLAVDRIDVLPSNFYVAAYTLKGVSQPVAGEIEQLPVMVETVPSYIAFSKLKKLGAVRDKFDAELQKFVASGEYRKVVESYNVPASALDFFLKK